MGFSRYSAWFLTETGKKFSYYAAGTFATSTLLGHLLPHTILLEKYKNFVHLYRKGFTVPLSEKLQNRFEKALELAGVLEEDRHLFKPFTAYGFDIFSAGSSYSHFGVIVGLPANFSYENPDTVDKHLIKIRDESVTWELDEGKAFLDSLILSENAQLYAMAREIKFRQTPKPLIDAVVAVISSGGAYGIANAINVKQNLYVRPLIVRVILYCIVGAFTFGSYALCKDFSQVYYENKIDKELKSKSPIFVEGGKEYYKKLLQRNLALRKLLGKEGERSFSILGNEIYLFRYKHIPLVDRKIFFEEEAKIS